METPAQLFWLVLAAPEGPDPAGVEKLRRLLERHGLTAGGGDALLRTRDGRLPVFGGEVTPVESAWLGPGAHTPYLQVHGISANPAQCGLLFDAAVAARLLLGVEPGPPHAVVCGGALDPEDYLDPSRPPELEVFCRVESPEELRDCLRGNADAYRYDRPD